MSTATGRIGDAAAPSVAETLRRGLQLSPEIRTGFWATLGLAAVATAGRVVVPFAVQQTIDRGLLAPGGPDASAVTTLLLVAGGLVVITAVCAFWVNLRLFRATESGLATLRIGAFRHVHDLSVLTQDSERRGSLVSRVTSDVDTISSFVQFGGLMLILSTLQLAVATVLMVVYSPP